MLLIPERTCFKIYMHFISAFSDSPIHLKISCWFSEIRDLKTNFFLPLCKKKRNNEDTENTLLYTEIKIKTLLHPHCSLNTDMQP